MQLASSKGCPGSALNKVCPLGGSRSRVTTLLYQKKPVEIVQATDQDASYEPAREGLTAMSHHYDAQGQTWCMLERLYLSADLATPRFMGGWMVQ